MEILHISLPNTCGLVVSESRVSYVEGDPSSKIYPPTDYTSFEQFITPEEALLRAKEIDPGFDPNLILGPLYLTPVSLSNPSIELNVGDSFTIHCEYSCESNPVSYQWLDKTGAPISGATASTLQLSEVTKEDTTTYCCKVSASNGIGQSAGNRNYFTVTVSEVSASNAIAE